MGAELSVSHGVKTAVRGTPNSDTMVHGGKPTGKKDLHLNPWAAVADLEERIAHSTSPLIATGEVHPGGNVSNVYAALRKLQKKDERDSVVAYVTLGNDGHTPMLRSFFENAIITSYDGLNVNNVVLNGGSDRDIISVADPHIPGGFRPETTNGEYVNVYLTSVKGEAWRQTYRDAITYKKENPHSILAVAPGSQQMDEMRDGDELYQTIEHADLLLVNKEEALRLIGEDPKTSTLLMPEILQRTRQLGAKEGENKLKVSITDGKNGSWAIDGEIIYNIPALTPDHLPELANLPIKNVIGGGDAYAAAFYQAFVEGKGIEEALRWGALNAAFTIRKEDANSGQLHRDEMEHYAKITHESFQSVSTLYLPDDMDAEPVRRR